MYQIGDMVLLERILGSWDGPFFVERVYYTRPASYLIGDGLEFFDRIPESQLRPFLGPNADSLHPEGI